MTQASGNGRHSTSDFLTKPYYTADERAPTPPPPGAFPFTRGFHPDGYRRKLWDWEMYAGFGSPEEANRRYRFLLDNGATGGVSVALDLPTQIGYDSDDAMALGEVGRVGVAIDTYTDFEQLFNGVDIASVGHVFSTANAIGPVFYGWMLTYCRKHDVDPASFRLQIQNDPIKEYYARGTHFLPIEAAVRLATDTVVFSHANTPTWLPISVSGSHMKQAGASPALEAAFTIANAIAYLEEVQRKGVPVKDFNPSLELHFCTDMDFFEEVAKYRAVRQAWSEIAAQRFEVPPDRMQFRLHAATSGLPLTAQQPMNNIARITLQALAQILGGCDGTRTASWDEALGIPTEEAAALSLRINQIIAHETGVPDATDPLGGSYYIEALTRQIRDVIASEVAQIDRMGGALAAVRSGYYAQSLAEGAYQQQQDLEEGRRIIVGINGYRTDDDVVYARFRHDETSEQRQLARLERHRAGREPRVVVRSLADLADACASDDNVVPAVIAAVEAGVTIGEISGCWRKVLGEHHDAWTAV